MGFGVAFLDRLRSVGLLSVGAPPSAPSQGQFVITGASWDASGRFITIQGMVSLGQAPGNQVGPVYTTASDGNYQLDDAYEAETAGGGSGYRTLVLTPQGSPVAFTTVPFSFGQWAKFNDHAWDVWVTWFNASWNQSESSAPRSVVSQHLRVVPIFTDPATGVSTGGQITLPNGQVVGGGSSVGGPTSTPPLPPLPPSQPVQPKPGPSRYAWPVVSAVVGFGGWLWQSLTAPPNQRG